MYKRQPEETSMLSTTLTFIQEQRLESENVKLQKKMIIITWSECVFSLSFDGQDAYLVCHSMAKMRI